MSQILFLAILCCVVACNFIIIIAVSYVILKRASTASHRCAEENRKEREAMAAEYKALAEKCTAALVQVGVALSEISDRLPPRLPNQEAITRRVASLG